MEIEQEFEDEFEDSDIMVDLIASGYEWTCPECEEFNTEIEITDEVICKKCHTKFSVSEAYHAYG